MSRKDIKKILVPLDGSKYSIEGLNEAIELAKPFGAKIIGLCVIPLTPPIMIPELPASFKSFMIDEAAKFMAEAKKIASRSGVEFQAKIIHGEATFEIAAFANDKKFDLVVIGSRGRSGIKELFLGSIANSVVHKSRIPVLVVK